MKKSTKLYLLGLVQFLAPVIWMLLLVLISKLTGPIMKSSVGSAFSGLTSIVGIILFFRGFFTLMKAKGVYEAEKENPEIKYALIEADKSKKAFRNLIKNLCSIGIAKEIYRNDSFSVLNFNDLFYLLCPYRSIINDEPFGIILTAENVRKFIDNSDLLSEFISNIDDATFSQMTVSLKENHFENLVKYCEEHTEERPSKLISTELENELKTNKIYKRLGILCACMSIVSFATMVISELVGFLMSVAVIVIGIKSIIRSRKEYIKIDWKAVVGVIISAVIIFMTIVELPKKFEKNDTNRSYTSSDYLEPRDVDIPNVKVPEYDPEDYKIPDSDMIDKITSDYKPTPSIRSYTTEISYKKGTITNNVFHSEFVSLYGRLPEGGYTWMSSNSLHDILPSVDWECGIKGLKSTTRITGLFTIYVGNNAGYEECIAALEKINPEFRLLDVSSAGSITIFTNMGLDDPQIQNRRKYGGASFINDTGLIRDFTINKVNDRLVCVFEQYAENDEERLSVFCEY